MVLVYSIPYRGNHFEVGVSKHVIEQIDYASGIISIIIYLTLASATAVTIIRSNLSALMCKDGDSRHVDVFAMHSEKLHKPEV